MLVTNERHWMTSPLNEINRLKKFLLDEMYEILWSLKLSVSSADFMERISEWKKVTILII